ncbi:MAG TPA: ATP-binding cassette domain-containing protein [Candidatus Avoscillospira avicola]|uniref:ATP-binding cassette domain-containing protein n=1 Tax=Candidatus Avoscillospira avicola TaxID=2840706 RepID=A0A9D1DFN0_9FIRM|nr:ATP-binding cassette domain-containing protein [Candidatus Avoscillospira avicola]
MENHKLLLSVKDLHVNFRVRGRTLSAIRGISLDFHEDESVAIVGESGSGKSVFTKTFAGMLDSNGYISEGAIIFHDEELADTVVALTDSAKHLIYSAEEKLNEYAKLENGAATYQAMEALKLERKHKAELSEEEQERLDGEIAELKYQRTELFNLKQTFDSSKEKARIKEAEAKIEDLDRQIKAKEKEKADTIAAHKQQLQHDTVYLADYDKRMSELKSRYEKEIVVPISDAVKARNAILAKEICLSVGRFSARKRSKYSHKLLQALRHAMEEGRDLNDDAVRNAIFDEITFRVKYLDETPEKLHGTCVLNLAKIRDNRDWVKIRGNKIATVFQDPMTSLNPIITIGKQITSVILEHQNCSEIEARARALELMKKVGIPNAESRFDDYPFQYSGGMRQRIVIAIALSCQPKILICDEPTTALDVTIQAQILKLIKDLQKEFHYTIVFITHDLGVVANVADRVAVLYAGQVVELGTAEDIFYDPRHPYTWALLSSLPQLAQRNTKLYSITGTPPSLYNKIVGDSFAPRNPYCLKIDTLEEPPMFQVSDTHYAKTWLLDPRAPKIEKPEIIQNIHEKLLDAFNI